MIIAAIGPINGGLSEAVTKLAQQESILDKRIDWLLCTGSLGAYPDKQRIPSNVIKHGTPQQFAEYYLEQRNFPFRAIFVRGPNEDHTWLLQRKQAANLNLIPNMTWLVDGYQTTLDEGCKITGLGGVFADKVYNSAPSWKIRPRAYRRAHIERACTTGRADILLCHDPPWKRGLKEVVFATRPQMIIHSAPTDKGIKLKEYKGVSTIALSPMEVVFLEWSNNMLSIV